MAGSGISGRLRSEIFSARAASPSSVAARHKRFQARAVRCGVTKLPDPCQAYLAAEIPANHSETGRAAIHLVDLLDVVDLADALAAFSETVRAHPRTGSSSSSVSARRLLAIELHFVLHLRFRRQQFGREIKRNTRFRFGLVKREPLA